MKSRFKPISLSMTVVCLVVSSFFVTTKRNYSMVAHSAGMHSLIPAPSANHSNSVLALAESLYDSLELQLTGLSQDAFMLAWKGYQKLLDEGKINNEQVLSVIDFTQPSNKKRLYIIDVKSKKLLIQSYVAHGRNSGMEYARSFSNKPESNKSSIGFYKTLSTYYGEHGLSLKLNGLERNFNDNAFNRAIVVHGSEYVNKETIRGVGHLGRSLGCPAVPMGLHTKIINAIKNGSCLFVYYPLKDYLKKSKLINS